MTADEATPDPIAAAVGDALVEHFRRINRTAMADVPICNPMLDVDQTGFRLYDGQVMGIIVTPWFMNLVLAGLPDAPLPDAAQGSRRSVGLPAGRVEFLVGDVPGFGRLDACSLFSPMQDFADHAAVMATAAEALTALFTAPEPPPPPTPPMEREMGRRNLLRGRISAKAEGMQP
jgi:[NiFe] hydrogenase assembly HybE family chaperone